MREAFESFGAVKNVRLARWHHTGNLKGFGYVTFKSEDAVDAVVKDPKGVSIMGRKLKLDYETGKPRAGQGRHRTPVDKSARVSSKKVFPVHAARNAALEEKVYIYYFYVLNILF